MGVGNRLIGKEEVEDLLNSLGPVGDGGARLNIRDLQVYRTAFVHPTFLVNPDPDIDFQPVEDNDVLEFLGDACLNLAVTQYIVERFSDQKEGFLTKLRALLVRTDMLYRLARFLGLGRYLLLSPTMDKEGPQKGRANPRFHEDCFEAFIGAIIRDFGDEDGYRYAKRFLILLVENQVDFASLITNNPNHKDVYQRYHQMMKWPNPVYVDMEEPYPHQPRVFVRATYITESQLDRFAGKVRDNVRDFHNRHLAGKSCEPGSVLVGVGAATRKSQSEQNCAKTALLNLGIPLNF
jgi:ribonuclease III